MQHWASLAVLIAVGGVAIPLFADAVNAASDVPADKQAVIDAYPSTNPGSADGTVEETPSPVRPAVADSGNATDLTAIKAAVPAAQTKFNVAQLLSPDLATRKQQAQAAASDVAAASDLGAASFVKGAKDTEAAAARGVAPAAAPASDFRVKMVAVFDASVVLDESLDLSAQLVSDALSTEIPSMVQTSFVLSAWQGVQVSGDTATALAIGAYNNCFAGGSFTETVCQQSPDQQWQLRLRRGADGAWRLIERIGVSADPVLPASEPAPPDPTDTPMPDPSTTTSAPEPSVTPTPGISVTPSPSTTPTQPSEPGYPDNPGTVKPPKPQPTWTLD